MNKFTLQAIGAAAQAFIAQMGGNKVFAFHGKMGAGKTTFIKALCEALGVDDVVTSPTFSIVNEYDTRHGGRIFHFDFYRVATLQEAVDFGVEEYFYSGNPCFLEWADNIAALLPDDVVNVYITENEDGTRDITLNPDS